MAKKRSPEEYSVDPAAQQMLIRADELGLATAFSRSDNLAPCNIGSAGMCCKLCGMGPCRLTKDGQTGICGATIDTIQARNLIRAIAAGKRAAKAIHRYLCGEEMRPAPMVTLPKVYIEPTEASEEDPGHYNRVQAPTIPVEDRKRSLAEVDLAISVEQAKQEAARCMRCDLEFTAGCTAGREKTGENYMETGEKSA